MPHNRYFLDAPFQEHQRVALEGDESHHLLRVLRAHEGDRIELVNGRSQLAKAIVSEVRKHAAVLEIETLIEEKKETPALILALALPRMNHLEWVIEKGCELGATAFWIFPGLLSEKRELAPSQHLRLKHLAIAAMKQCGRLDLPDIAFKPHLLKWAPLPGTVLFGDTAENAPYLWDLRLTAPLDSPITFFIGPESGFAPEERIFLSEALKARGARLHPHILRAETAPLVALSLLRPLL